MKRIKYLLLSLSLLSVLSPLSVYAEDEEVEDETEEVQEDEEEVDEAEEIPVDEENDSPFLEIDEENQDQTTKEKEFIKKPIEAPASVTGKKYNGSGTVIDFTTTGSKAFYTVETTDREVFYIVIDLDKTEDNVYFLSAISGEEMSLGEVTAQPEQSEPFIPTEPEQDPIEQEETTEETERNSGSSSTFIIWGVVIFSISYLAYYYLIGKGKGRNPIKDLMKKEQNEVPKENKDNADEEDKEETENETDTKKEEVDTYGELKEARQKEEEIVLVNADPEEEKKDD